MRKCSVDLVTGFLSSGKTSFINVFLNKTLKREETIIIQCEDGKENINKFIKERSNVSVKKFHSYDELTIERFVRMIKFYKPERMIIECNGVEDISKVVAMFNETKLRAYFKVSGVINVIDALTFNMFLQNLPHLIRPCIEISDLIIFNKANELSDERIDLNLNIIKEMNVHAHIVVAYDKYDLEKKINKAKIITA